MTDDITLPTYAALDKALSKTALKLNPSQAHGLLCGLLCGNPESPPAWEELVTGGVDTAKAHELLQTLHAAASKQFRDFLFEFQLILPPDSVDLAERAESLSLWCQGFLTGLKLTQVSIEDRNPSDTTEAINDLIEIAQMRHESVVDSEEDETAYMELVEYVRMAAILIYQTLREPDASQKPIQDSNHLH